MKNLILIIFLFVGTVLFSQTVEPNFYWERSKTYANNKQVPEAIQDLDTMLSLGVKTTEVYYRKGFLLEYLADNKSPYVLHYRPKQGAAINEKEVLKKEVLDLYTSAEENYLLALQLDPTNKKAATQLKYLKLDLKDIQSIK